MSLCVRRCWWTWPSAFANPMAMLSPRGGKRGRLASQLSRLESADMIDANIVLVSAF
jgi:hypothetical protein